jgi:hypothetical protein
MSSTAMKVRTVRTFQPMSSGALRTWFRVSRMTYSTSPTAIWV